MFDFTECYAICLILLCKDIKDGMRACFWDVFVGRLRETGTEDCGCYYSILTCCYSREYLTSVVVVGGGGGDLLNCMEAVNALWKLS